MDSDERAICDYLKSWPKTYVSGREIARRADGKRRFRDQPQWAYPVLSRLLETALIETDGLGHYRFVVTGLEKRRSQKWLSPQMRRVLERSGRDFTEVFELPEDNPAPAKE
jgi:hypothetical protein